MSSPQLRDAHTSSNQAPEAAREAAVVMNAVEILVAEAGMGAVTLHDLSVVTGCPGATLRAMYGSRAALIGSTWLRASRRLLVLLTSLIEETAGNAIDKAVAAAEAAVLFPRQYPRSAALLAAVSRDQLIRRPLPAPIVAQLHRLEEEFVGVMRRLSVELWNRDDADAVDVISVCVVDIPQRLLRRRDGSGVYFVREYLSHAVRGVLACGPPPESRRSGAGRPVLRLVGTAATVGARP